MKTIYKYPLYTWENKVSIPKGADIISVINQQEVIQLYALIDTESKKIDRTVYIIATGYIFPDELLNKSQFIGTVSTCGGDLIWHIFIDNE